MSSLPSRSLKRLRHTSDVAGIEMNMRVAVRMNVALRTVDRARHFELLHEVGGHEVTGLARPHLAVAGSLNQQRQPAHLEIGARADQQIRRAHARDQAGPRFDAMRILQRGGRLVDRYFVAADLVRQRRPFRLARENIDSGVRVGCPRSRAARLDKLQCAFHVR